MDQTLAILTISHYVCAICWSDLEWRPDNEVVCSKYGDQHQGFVTRYHVDDSKRRDVNDAMEARQLLMKVGVLPDPHKGKSAEQLTKELGF